MFAASAIALSLIIKLTLGACLALGAFALLNRRKGVSEPE